MKRILAALALAGGLCGCKAFQDADQTRATVTWEASGNSAGEANIQGLPKLLGGSGVHCWGWYQADANLHLVGTIQPPNTEGRVVIIDKTLTPAKTKTEFGMPPAPPAPHP